jgi:hypothetical protein
LGRTITSGRAAPSWSAWPQTCGGSCSGAGVRPWVQQGESG